MKNNPFLFFVMATMKTHSYRILSFSLWLKFIFTDMFLRFFRKEEG